MFLTSKQPDFESIKCQAKFALFIHSKCELTVKQKDHVVPIHMYDVKPQPLGHDDPHACEDSTGADTSRHMGAGSGKHVVRAQGIHCDEQGPMRHCIGVL